MRVYACIRTNPPECLVSCIYILVPGALLGHSDAPHHGGLLYNVPQPSSEDSKGDHAYSPSTRILINPTVLLSLSQKSEKFCRKPEAAFSVLEVSCQQCYWQE